MLPPCRAKIVITSYIGAAIVLVVFRHGSQPMAETTTSQPARDPFDYLCLHSDKTAVLWEAYIAAKELVEAAVWWRSRLAVHINT